MTEECRGRNELRLTWEATAMAERVYFGIDLRAKSGRVTAGSFDGDGARYARRN
jgi:hypothetical protein